MIHKKTTEEIRVMAQGGKLLSEILKELCSIASKGGITTGDLDSIAQKMIEKTGGEPSFKRVKGYHHSLCTTVNDEVVHSIPGNYLLKEGDILGIDVGLYYKGFHTDTSATIPIGNVSNEAYKFLEAGKLSLADSLAAAKSGNTVWDISKAMETPIKAAGYSPVKSLTGHGVGKELHEEPSVPCFAIGKRENSIVLEPGMVLAIETIYNQGSPEVVYSSGDGWTISTQDGSLSATFEASIAILEDKSLILTPVV